MGNLVHLGLYQRVVFKTTHFPCDPATTESHCGCSSLIPFLRFIRTFFNPGDPGAVSRVEGIFVGEIRQFKCSWNWYGKSNCPGALPFLQ